MLDLNKTGIATVNVIVPGLNYKVGDKVRFNNDQSGGSGATAKVVTLVGKGLSTFSFNRKVVPDVSFIYTDGAVVGVASTPHGLTDHDLVVVGGIGTGELNFIQKLDLLLSHLSLLKQMKKYHQWIYNWYYYYNLS